MTQVPSVTASLARTVSPGSVALRVLLLVAPVVALLLTAVQGPGPRLLLLAAVVGLAAGAAVAPESPLLVVCLGLVVGWWVLAAGSRVPFTAVPAAWLVLSAHQAATVLGHGPRELAVDRALLALWVRRTAALAVAPLLLWSVVGLAGQTAPAGIWVAGLVAASLGCLAGAVATSRAGR